MDGLRFESEAALLVALRAGLVPAAVAERPVRFAREPEEPGRAGAIVVDVSALTGGIRAALIQAGARKVPRPSETEEAPFWLAIARPTALKELQVPEVLLFRVGEPDSGLELAAALLGLGARRLELAAFRSERGAGALLLATGASHYHVERARERVGELSVYARVAPERDDVWLELGWSSPDLAGLRAAPEQLALIDRAGRVELVSRSAFADAQARLELQLAHAQVATPAPLSGKIVVRLRLLRGVHERAPTLWVLRHDGVRALDRLLQSANERLLTSISFFVSGEPADPCVVLRAAPGAGASLGSLEGEAYCALPELGDVYVPTGKVLHPPVAPHRLRAAIGGPDERVRWLSERDGEVRVESALASAFCPLSEWTEIVAAKAELEPWVRNVSLDARAFVVGEVASSGSPAPPQPAREVRPKGEVARVAERPAPVVERGASASRPNREPRPPPPPRVVQLPTSRTEVEARVLRAEQAIAGSAEPLSAPSRDAAWLELGQAYAAAALPIEARICFARVATSPEIGRAARSALLDGALRARGLDASGAWPAALARDERGARDLELLTALLLAVGDGAPPPPADSVPVATELLDAGDGRLDVRSAWLARLALSRLSGGDPLLLARARDRALGRLERGLSLGRDLPRAVRAIEDPRAAERLRLLSDVLAHFEATPRMRGPLEGAAETTMAYVRLVLACALARAGDAPRARALLEAALGALPASDAVHAVLSGSFAARVQQALEQEVEGAPLPPEIVTRLHGLGKLERYKVDRVRQACKLLEPEPDLDPFRSFGQQQSGAASAAVARVAHAALPSEAAALLDELGLAAEREAQAASRRELLAAWIAALGYAPRSVAAPRLEGVVRVALTLEPADRVRAICSTVALAERLSRHELAALLVTRLSAEIAELPLSAVAAIVPHVVRGAGELRRGPSRPELERLYRGIGAIIAAARDTPARVARLALVRGLAEIGAVDGADELDADVALLETGDLSPADRLQLARGVAACASALGLLEIVRRVAVLWRRMTDSYNTNSHLCLSAVELSDCVAWSLTPRRGDRVSVARVMADEDEPSVRALVFGGEG